MERRILILGDSNTWGWVPGGEGARYPEDVRWSGKIRRNLGSNYRVFEEGLCYRTIDSPTAGLPWSSGTGCAEHYLDRYKPLDLVVVMLGTNDTRDICSESAGTIAIRMDKLVRQIQSAGFNVLLISPPRIRREMASSFLMYEWDFSRAAILRSEELATVFMQVAEARGCGFMDAAQVCEVSPVDCLHLDPEGHAALAEAAAVKIRTIIHD